MSNVETVQEMYAAFGRGDVPAILAKLDENVQWEINGSSSDVPWLQHRQGRDGALAFFQSLGALEFHKFEVTAVVPIGDDRVLSLCNIETTITANGRRNSEEDEVHIWWFNADGQVTGFRHRVDTHHQWKEFHATA
ncbi:MAG TPA: nuclear transport factor 2 family protein [Thermoanaerobaculia bacterium]